MIVQTLLSHDDMLWHGEIQWSEVMGELVKNPYNWAKNTEKGAIKLADRKLHPDVAIVVNYPPHWHSSPSIPTRISLFQHTNVILVNPADNPAPPRASKAEDPAMRVTLVPDLFQGYWHYLPPKHHSLGTILETWVDDPIDTLVGAQPPRNDASRSQANLFVAATSGLAVPTSDKDRAFLVIDPQKPLQFIFTWNEQTNEDTPAECVKSGGQLLNKPNDMGGSDYTILTSSIWYYSYATAWLSPTAKASTKKKRK